MDPGRLRHTINIQKSVLAPDAISGSDMILDGSCDKSTCSDHALSRARIFSSSASTK
ncbi:phage protein [Proteus mirabilis]|uniref:Phage protein n=1 Tax=Proteus mirabilis TaxID=584 RepID=A0A379FFR4_PROMI|nr:phage protein [Proteus mirabilis]